MLRRPQNLDQDVDFSYPIKPSKAVRLSTPMSETSTAPNTPMIGASQDPFNATKEFKRTWSQSSQSKYGRTISGASTFVPEEYGDSDDWEDDFDDLEMGEADSMSQVMSQKMSVRRNEYGQLVDEDGMAWVEVSGTGPLRQRETYDSRVQTLEEKLKEVKGLYKKKTGQSVDADTTYKTDAEGTAWVGVSGHGASIQRGKYMDRMEGLADKLEEVKDLFKDKYGYDPDAFDKDEPAYVDADGTPWIEVRGDGSLDARDAYNKRMARLEQSLEEVKGLYKAKTGQHVDADKTYRCDGDGMMWEVISGQGAQLQRATYEERVDGLSDKLAEVKALFKNKYGYGVDDEEEELAMSNKRLVTISCPPLMSKLGKWAESVVHAEEWLQQELARTHPQEYVVDNSRFKTQTMGLSFRMSKNSEDRNVSIPGPLWGSTVMGTTDGDGWLQVGEHYLPMTIGGIPVIVPSVGHAMRDGPSFTKGGRAVDLESGSAIFFSHRRDDSQGSTAKAQLKADHRLMQAARLAHSACEAEDQLGRGAACALDAQGVVRAGVPRAGLAAYAASAALRLKRFHRLRQARTRMAMNAGADPNLTLCAGPDGKVCLLLVFDSGKTHRDRVQRKRSMLQRPQSIADENGESAVGVMDAQGVIHYYVF